MADMMIDYNTTSDDSSDVVGSKADVLKAVVRVTPPQPSYVKRWNVPWGIWKRKVDNDTVGPDRVCRTIIRSCLAFVHLGFPEPSFRL
ncbi:hypothetical protein TNCV_3430521 [Trichonephila clavipes]|nr:hypothetical protein TNCV_3430521 [Trichonephila clavipes]